MKLQLRLTSVRVDPAPTEDCAQISSTISSVTVFKDLKEINAKVCFSSVDIFICLVYINGLFVYYICLANIDDCASNPCQNDATCIDGINSYRCSCRGGFLGTHCESKTA